MLTDGDLSASARLRLRKLIPPFIDATLDYAQGENPTLTLGQVSAATGQSLTVIANLITSGGFGPEHVEQTAAFNKNSQLFVPGIYKLAEAFVVANLPLSAALQAVISTSLQLTAQLLMGARAAKVTRTARNERYLTSKGHAKFLKESGLYATLDSAERAVRAFSGQMWLHMSGMNASDIREVRKLPRKTDLVGVLSPRGAVVLPYAAMRMHDASRRAVLLSGSHRRVMDMARKGRVDALNEIMLHEADAQLVEEGRTELAEELPKIEQQALATDSIFLPVGHRPISVVERDGQIYPQLRHRS